jgi:glycosyltransferase involved in cell wall biosynthesis
VTVIVPALYEAESFAAVIQRVPYPPRAVIVADNGSTDGTAALAEEAGARVVRVPRRGYGRACLAGIAADPDADVFVFLDADLSEAPKRCRASWIPLSATKRTSCSARAAASDVHGMRASGRRCVWA